MLPNFSQMVSQPNKVLMNYKKLNIKPHDRIEVAYRKVVRYVLPDVDSDVVVKVANIVLKDKEYRPRVLRVISDALDVKC